MKRKLLIFSVILSLTWACNDATEFPDPTLKIQFEHFTFTDCCLTSVPFSDQDSIYLLQLDSTIIVSFVENFLTNPELIGGDSKTPNDFIYTFEIKTSQGDREVFVSNRNVDPFGSVSSDALHNDIWYSKAERDFIIPLAYSATPVLDNAVIELDPDSNVTLSVSYSSQFSDLSVEKEISIRQ